MTKLNQPLCFLCWVTALALAALVANIRGDETAAEQLPPGASVVAVEARPGKVELTHKLDYRQLLVTGKLDSGETVDLTRMGKASVDSAAASVSAEGLVRAKEDGSAKIT